MKKWIYICGLGVLYIGLGFNHLSSQNLATYQLPANSVSQEFPYAQGKIPPTVNDDVLSRLAIVSKGIQNQKMVSQVDIINRIIWWRLDQSDESLQFELVLGEPVNDRTSEMDTGEKVLLPDQNQALVTYRYRTMPVPNGVDPIHSRGGYLHPIRTLKGGVLTRIQPPDHYHHYGVWNPWTHTEINGKIIDFWNLYQKQATVKASPQPWLSSGPLFSEVEGIHHHIVKNQAGQDSLIAMREKWKIRLWHPSQNQSHYILDITSNLQNALDSAMTIKAYRYQGFGMRATELWDDESASLLTSEGFNKSDANATRARWCRIEGPTQTGPAGVLFITHPSNHNYPEQLRIWPTGANEGKSNVFFNFNPAQEQDWILKPLDTKVLTYRMVIYDGQISTQEAEVFAQDFQDSNTSYNSLLFNK